MALNDNPGLSVNDLVKQAYAKSQDGSVVQKTLEMGKLVPDTFDHITLTYVSSGDGTGEIETSTYREGGSGGTVVGTLTLAYDSSDRLSTVTKT